MQSAPKPQGSLFQSVFTFSALTVVSRILGFARDALIFIGFGAGLLTDAFLVAFRLPNFLRRLFGEGALAQAFIPVYQETREQQGEAAAKDLLHNMAGTLGAVLFVVMLVGVFAAPLLIAIFAPGFVNRADSSYELASYMLRITSPYLLFISLVALLAAVLNSHNLFFSTAFSPIILNVTLILTTIFFASNSGDYAITVLAWGVLVAGVLQFLFQVVWMRTRLGMTPLPKWGFRHAGVRKVAKLMTPAILSSGVMQVNLIFDTIIASFLITGSISWLYISDRFVELPLALFGIAISTVILPHLATHFINKADAQFHKTMEWGVGGAALLALPCTVGLILLAEPILASFIQYRQFSAYDTQMASLSLAAYATGLPAFMLVKILSSAFYARQNPVVPMRIAIIAMLTNMVLNVSFVLLWKAFEGEAEHVALALATSLASWLNFLLLYRVLRRENVFTASPKLLGDIAKFVAAAAIMGIVLFFLLSLRGDWDQMHDWWQRILHLFVLVLVGAAVYFVSLRALRVRLSQFMHPG